MSKQITLDEIDEKIRKEVYTEDYSYDKIKIEGVKLIETKIHVGEEGDFSEIIKLSQDGELENLPGFKLAQINRTKLNPNSVKAWHLHFTQDEIWYLIPSDHLFVGLWDLREDSPTKDETMRVVLGGGTSQLLFIPRGVAHGSSNFLQRPVELFYFTSEKFNRQQPDEKRIHWDAKGADFWSPQRD